MADLNQERRWKEEFARRMLQIEEHNKRQNHYNVMTKESCNKLVNETEEAQSAEKKTQKQYRRLTPFKVINICGTRTLVTRKEPMKYYVCVEEIFDIIEAVHEALGHGGRDRLKVETSRKYANITVEMINIYPPMCETCQRKRSIKKRGHVSKPILHSEMNSCCQVDLIDMHTQEDRGFKYIVVNQDHLTKCVLLHALQDKRAEEVAQHLENIFLTFGARILHSDSSREFVNSVINELAFLKNRAYRSGIKQTPYKAMFGTEPRVGLMTSSLALDVIKEIQDEDDLKEALNKYRCSK
ncbi:KRAB-A domain-containing protein 2-like [Schistocerca americana]|uniref:KRAB-A domain-containing protein 2-like n=1 Tax=Schistocerca americana TaxID=7009 RepID=UPI001F4F261D|nr:KRAB-A domain-containing protein 2-like [Schistocerca americana]